VTPEYVYVGDHPQVLSNGRTLVHDDRVEGSELSDADQYLVDDEKLIEPPATEASAEAEAEPKRGRSSRAS
jgi:hypothetical protein